MPRCRAQTRARIVGAALPAEQGDVGKVVFIVEQSELSTEEHWWWRCISLSGPLVMVSIRNGRSTGDIVRTTTASIHDDLLEPLLDDEIEMNLELPVDVVLP